MDCNVYNRTPGSYQETSRKIMKLRKGLPGTKQARRLWNNQFTLWVNELGFQQLTSESCMFYKLDQDGKETRQYGLTYKKTGNSKPIIKAFCDIGWAGDRDNGKSTTGIVVKFNGNIIYNSSTKQTCIALSTLEAEYVAGSKELQICLTN
jgi:hypothetical protein